MTVGSGRLLNPAIQTLLLSNFIFCAHCRCAVRLRKSVFLRGFAVSGEKQGTGVRGARATPFLLFFYLFLSILLPCIIQDTCKIHSGKEK